MGLILLDFVVFGRVVSEVILQSLSTYKSRLEKGSETIASYFLPNKNVSF